jgi:voltage-gated potassium channel
MSARPGIGRGPVRSRLADRAERAVANRRVFPYLVGATALMCVGSGIIARLLDHRDFHSYGDGIWWAIVTIPTVGYGDIVPTTTWGRIIGSVVIVFGVTFLSFLIAIVTSLFVDANRDHLERARAVREEETQTLLRSIDARISAIEERLGPAHEPHRP